MEIEFDPAKSDKTLRDRGFGFAYAARVFLGPVVEFDSKRSDLNERRIVALGEVEGEVLAVVYTDRGDVRRIISARRASRKERRIWKENQ